MERDLIDGLRVAGNQDLPYHPWTTLSMESAAMTVVRKTSESVDPLGREQLALRSKLEGQRIFEFGKRIFDIVAAIAGLALFLPLLPFLAIMVKLESEGPLFFRQPRVGRYGRVFNCYKIRSMVVNAEELKDRLSHLNEADGAAFKIRNDPRITRVGRFVRRSSLDEFPQLWNVLLGDMSIVGPRPQIPAEVAEYTAEQRMRLLVKPGITCLWQISGRNDVDFDEWMRLDRDYVLRRSSKLDFWILMRTIPAVIHRRGAY